MKKEQKYLILIITLFTVSFGLYPVLATARPIIDDPPSPPPPPPLVRTLICVHGYLGDSSAFNTLKNRANIKGYYDNIIAIDYYNTHSGYETEFKDVTCWTSLNDVSVQLKNYIVNKHNSGQIGYKVDIVCHSMGGLIVRHMIKNFYPAIKSAGVTIYHVATIGTPNHGVVGGILGCTTQTLEMEAIFSLFLIALNFGDETPNSKSDSTTYHDVKYSVQRGLLPIIGNDGLVEPWSAALYSNDVYLYGTDYVLGYGIVYNMVNHGDLLTSNSVANDLYNFLAYA
jgi:hypothetical protein